MIDDHQEGIDDLEGKAENAADPDVKAWAARALPTMRQHLERARSIKETLDRAGTN
jgi:putative membrane protein